MKLGEDFNKHIFDATSRSSFFYFSASIDSYKNFIAYEFICVFLRRILLHTLFNNLLIEKDQEELTYEIR